MVPQPETVQDLVNLITSGDKDHIHCALIKARRNPSILLPLFQKLATCPAPGIECRIAFHGAWVTQGLYLREFFAIDPVLPAMLVNMMPGYSGQGVELFRGERWSNCQSGAYGPSWSSKQSIARTFAGGLNCEPENGGVVLRSFVPASAILAGPEHGHMPEEQEYLVDRRGLLEVQAIERCFVRR
jgi:hypothetical protein